MRAFFLVYHQGQKFTADLLTDGSIRWREEDKVFNSPSAWALHCKKIVNPSKKSGCGWASVCHEFGVAFYVTFVYSVWGERSKLNHFQLEF